MTLKSPVDLTHLFPTRRMGHVESRLMKCIWMGKIPEMNGRNEITENS